MTLCQICKKNPATIHIQENVNGKKQELHLCLECAGKRAAGPGMLNGMDLSEVLSILERELGGSVFPLKGIGKEPENKELDALECPDCRWTGIQFRKTGHLGCPKCYDVFEKELINRCLELHRSPVHTGKIPELPQDTETFSRMMAEVDHQKQRRQKLDELEQDLRQAVRREEYELAAELRDKISALLSAEQENVKS